MIGLTAFLALLLLALPLTYYAASVDSVDSFENRKSLIRKLFRTQREAEVLKNAPLAVSAQDLQARAQGKLATLGLSPEQVGGVTPYDNASAGKPIAAVPKGVIQSGAAVALRSLNLRQVVDIGYDMQALDPSVKLVGLEVHAAAANPHYFDVIYKLVSFSIPVDAEPLPEGGKAGKAAPSKRPPSAGSRKPEARP